MRKTFIRLLLVAVPYLIYHYALRSEVVLSLLLALVVAWIIDPAIK